MFTIEYDNTISEIETAAKMFWKKYALRRTLLFSGAFLIIISVLIFRIATDTGAGIISWILLGLGLGLLTNLWLKPARRRKHLLLALQNMYQEKYAAEFCETAIEIQTLIQSHQDEQVEKSRYEPANDELFSQETHELFLLYVNRWSTIIFPKRCMSEQQINDLRSYFTNKKI
jgi:hypothetical protein